MRSDSLVVVGHIQREFEAKEERMKKYLLRVKELVTQFKDFAIKKRKRNLLDTYALVALFMLT